MDPIRSIGWLRQALILLVLFECVAVAFWRRSSESRCHLRWHSVVGRKGWWAIMHGTYDSLGILQRQQDQIDIL